MKEALISAAIWTFELATMALVLGITLITSFVVFDWIMGVA